MLQEYRGIWVSFLEYEQMNFSCAQDFMQDFEALCINCKNLGLNTLIVHVRPFADALYQSRIFPASHLAADVQGAPLPFDPLQIILQIAKTHHLRVEGWVNPYRVLSPAREIAIDSNHIALKWIKEDTGKSFQRVIPWEKGLYFNPASQDVQSLIADGVQELIENYNLDGIQFDDYFYPTTDAAFDRGSRQGKTEENDLASWRRIQVSQMVKKVYKRIKAVNEKIMFGISPQGDRTINQNQQYCDIDLWQREAGYLDYVMPQLYWGFHENDPHSQKHFTSSLKEWQNLPRHDNIALYAGLGAYHIGLGDGFSTEQGEWQSGTQLAKMIEALRKEAFQGFSLFRYHSLFPSSLQENIISPSLIQKERESLHKLL